MPSVTVRVAAAVRSAMAERKVTQTDLAAVMGLSQQSVSRRVSGVQPFDVEELGLVASHLGVDLGDLLTNADAADAAYAEECRQAREQILATERAS